MLTEVKQVLFVLLKFKTSFLFLIIQLHSNLSITFFTYRMIQKNMIVSKHLLQKKDCIART